MGACVCLLCLCPPLEKGDKAERTCRLQKIELPEPLMERLRQSRRSVFLSRACRIALSFI